MDRAYGSVQTRVYTFSSELKGCSPLLPEQPELVLLHGTNFELADPIRHEQIPVVELSLRVPQIHVARSSAQLPDAFVTVVNIGRSSAGRIRVHADRLMWTPALCVSHRGRPSIQI